jgi:hypothetical protein
MRHRTSSARARGKKSADRAHLSAQSTRLGATRSRRADAAVCAAPWPAAAPNPPDRLPPRLPRHAAVGPGQTARMLQFFSTREPTCRGSASFEQRLPPTIPASPSSCTRPALLCCASRSSSFMSGKLALGPLRVCWARLGRTSFAPLGGWFGSRHSSASASVQPRSHARCALRARASGRRHSSARSRSRSCRACGEQSACGTAARSRAPERDRFARRLLDRHDAAAPCEVERHLRARHCAHLRVHTRAHAHAPRDTFAAGCNARASARPVPHFCLPSREHAALAPSDVTKEGQPGKT